MKAGQWRVAVVAGYNNSKHAIALVDGLAQIDSIKLIGVGCVRWLAVGRMRKLLRKYGVKNSWLKLKNIWAEKPENTFYEETRHITEYLSKKGVKTRTLSSLCTLRGIGLLKINSVNDDRLKRWLRDNETDLLIYSGGGIIRKEVLDVLRIGALNAHGGPLPCFRGMNSLEWSLAYGVCPEISVHLIEKGIDTGPILSTVPIEIEEGDTVPRLRGKSVVREVEALLAVVQNFAEAYRARKYQNKNDGLQFFIMHPSLKELLDFKLKSGWRPRTLCKDFHFPMR